MGTSTNDFKMFKREVERWLDFLKPTAWTVDIKHFKASCSEHENVAKSPTTTFAWAGFNEWGSQNAVICLNKEYDEKTTLTEDELSKAAFHEVVHLLFRNLQCLAVMRFGVTEEMIDAEEHIILSVLQNAVWTSPRKEKK